MAVDSIDFISVTYIECLLFARCHNDKRQNRQTNKQQNKDTVPIYRDRAIVYP